MVQTVEGFVGHQDFSSNLEFLRPAGSVQLVGDIGNFKGVAGNVVSLNSVSAREGTEQHAVAVGKANGGTVELQLTAVCEGCVNGFGSPVGKFLHFLDAVGVAQGKHRVLVRILGKTALRGIVFQVRPHATSGGIRGGELGKIGLQRFQLMHQLVILVVAHGGRVLHIILPAVLPENSLQLLNPLAGLERVHR